jgi:uncharacterized protein YceK
MAKMILIVAVLALSGCGTCRPYAQSYETCAQQENGSREYREVGP